jgi:hypothetical protein
LFYMKNSGAQKIIVVTAATLALGAGGVSLTAASADAAPQQPPAASSMSGRSHDATVVRFGICDWRAVCGDHHASTGGPWVASTPRMTSGGAMLDAAQHYAAYLP